jgi:hypothetical protein
MTADGPHQALVAEASTSGPRPRRGGLAPADHERLQAIKVELDRYWALLRRRRVDPNAPEIQPYVPDPNNDLDGPDPEPPHEPGESALVVTTSLPATRLFSMSVWASTIWSRV